MNLEIEVDVADQKKADAIAKALTADSKPKRGTFSSEATNGKIRIDIHGSDKVALRASANSSLRLLDACLSIMR
ncbi:KEOPS complex subunit Pcc1 [archaeon]